MYLSQNRVTHKLFNLLQGGLKVLQINRRWEESLLGGSTSFHIGIAANCDVGVMLAIAVAIDDYEREIR